MALSSLPRITVVTPSYNQGQFLEETMLSVLNQDYPNLEYIVIDGKSTDNSVEVIKKHADRLAYWESEKDRGFAHAINKGFAKATGEIICWLNSDDLLLPGTLMKVGKFFQTYPEIELVFGDRWTIDEKSNLIGKTRFYYYSPAIFRHMRSIAQECAFWRKDVFDEIGGINENYNYAIDFDLWCRFALRGKVRHIPFYLGAFRRHSMAKSSTISQLGPKEGKDSILRHFGRFPSPSQMSRYSKYLGFSRRVYRWSGMYAIKRWLYRNLD